MYIIGGPSSVLLLKNKIGRFGAKVNLMGLSVTGKQNKNTL
jgi:hypothetical protein